LELEPGLFFWLSGGVNSVLFACTTTNPFYGFLLHRLGGGILGDISSASEESIMADYFHL